MPKKAASKKIPAPLSGDFVQAYLVAALWSSTIYGDEDSERNEDPFDKHYEVEDFNDDALISSINDCNNFIKENREDLNATGADDEQHGHDFWLTRNGHGAGFWDRGYGKVGDKLSNAAKAYGEVNLYEADGNKVGLE
jgi:hypothetical protein